MAIDSSTWTVTFSFNEIRFHFVSDIFKWLQNEQRPNWPSWSIYCWIWLNPAQHLVNFTIQPLHFRFQSFSRRFVVTYLVILTPLAKGDMRRWNEKCDSLMPVKILLAYMTITTCTDVSASPALLIIRTAPSDIDSWLGKCFGMTIICFWI